MALLHIFTHTNDFSFLLRRLRTFLDILRTYYVVNGVTIYRYADRSTFIFTTTTTPTITF